MFITVRYDNTIDGLWEELQDLLRSRGMEGQYVVKDRWEGSTGAYPWFLIDVPQRYFALEPIPKVCPVICHYLEKIGYKQGATSGGGRRFDP